MSKLGRDSDSKMWWNLLNNWHDLSSQNTDLFIWDMKIFYLNFPALSEQPDRNVSSKLGGLTRGSAGACKARSLRRRWWRGRSRSCPESLPWTRSLCTPCPSFLVPPSRERERELWKICSGLLKIWKWVSGGSVPFLFSVIFFFFFFYWERIFGEVFILLLEHLL